MQRFCLYLDKNQNLVFSKISEDNSVTEKDVIAVNENVYRYIDYLASQKIESVEEFNERNYANIKYEDVTLVILDVKDIIKKEPLKNIVTSIRNYVVHKEMLSKKNRVTRKNKYTKSVIVAGSLVVALLTGSLAYSSNKEAKKDLDNSPSVTIEHDVESNTSSNNVDSSSSSENINEYSQFYNNLYASLDSEIENYITNKEYNNVPKIYVDHEDRSSENKAVTTRELYQELIEKYSKIYGVDKNLILGIATQERGIHSQTMDEGGATGLMQIQNAVWDNQELCAYNFDTGEYEKIIVNVNDLSDLEYNIKVGTMILQNTLTYMDYNLCAAIQCYNMGYGNMKTILTQYAIDSGKSIEEILSSNDLGWLEYRNLINEGDQNYLEHVMSWIGNDFMIKNKKPNGELCELCISCPVEIKKANFN